MKRILISFSFFVVVILMTGSVSDACIPAGDLRVVYSPSLSTYDCRGDVVGYVSEHSSIQSAVDAGTGDVVVCPGAYTENVWIKYSNTTIRSWSADPSDTIIQAANSNKSVIYVGPVYVNGREIINHNINGFTITGATGGAPCSDPSPDNIPSDGRWNPQPCAGIRIWCAIAGGIMDNVIYGNNYGVIIKDTLPGWWFDYDVNYNTIFNNNTGIKYHYGNSSSINYNYIYNNSTGILFIDTQANGVTNNLIESNNVGMQLKSVQYSAGYANKNNVITENIIQNNNEQVLDDAACPTGGYQHYWYRETTGIGNVWSDYSGIDTDGDYVGDTNLPHPFACFDSYPLIDYDPDNDGVVYAIDNCPFDYNPQQKDLDNDGFGDICDSDTNSDNDGMPDYWELSYFGNLDQVGTGDYDGDGRTNQQEYQQGTNPLVNDNNCTNLPVQIIEPGKHEGIYYYYSSLQEAYYSYYYGSFRAQATTFTENLNINDYRHVSIQSGYDCDYATNTGTTVFNGALDVTTGSLEISNGSFAIE